MNAQNHPTVATSETNGLVYLVRRAGLAVVLLAVVSIVIAASTGRLDGAVGFLPGYGDQAAAAELSAAAPAPAAIEAAPANTVTSSGPIVSAPTASAPATRPEAPAARPATPATPAPPAARPTTTAVAPAAVENVDPKPGAPIGASKLIAQAPERLLDTRGAGAAARPTPGTTYAVTVPKDRVAVALSVSVISAEKSGSVFLDGSAGTVEALSVGQGGSTTNLMLVPVIGERLTVRSDAGGHLVVDLVGTFVRAQDGASDGRFVAVAPTRITNLETAVDGREATLTFGQAVPDGQASALLVQITADVGADGGVVQLGPNSAAYDQFLVWGPAAGDSRQRMGLALIEPGPDGAAGLLYNGGSVLAVDVLGYFTDAGAERGFDGLFVPAGPRLVHSGQLVPGQPAVLDNIDPTDGIAVATVARRTAAGGLSLVTAQVRDGSIQVNTSTPIEADITLLGVFL